MRFPTKLCFGKTEDLGESEKDHRQSAEENKRFKEKIMAKIADRYFCTEPFSVTERGFDPAHNQVAESIFSLGNEYMGVRGFAEEGVSAPTLKGSYFNGIYEYALEDTPIHYKGIVQRTHFMINSVDWLKTEIEADGEKLDTAVSDISEYVRTLDFKSGVLSRRFVWKTKSGHKILCEFERFLSMVHCRRGYQRLRFTSLAGNACVKVVCALDGNALHWGNHCYWEHEDSGTDAEQGVLYLSSVTPTTGQRVVCAQKIAAAGKGVFSSDKRNAQALYTLFLEEGKRAEIARYTVNRAEKKISVPKEEAKRDAEEELAASASAGWDEAFKEARDYWERFWEASDIEIEGDEENQQGIRFCLFQLQQTYHGYDPANNIGAKGLTGEAYSGHAFWDTETYCLPYYLLNNPAAAKNLLLYRYSKLPEAKERAKMLDCEGACYPIATLNGTEGCNLWQHASLQFQPSTGIVYGVWHYEHVTKDEAFVRDYGFEMTAEVTKFLLSRGQWNAAHTKFGFYAVMGPDEFQMMVNHNCYTNFMAKKSFEYFLELCRRYPEKGAELGIDAEFCARVEEAAAKTYLPFDKSRGIFEQHEGFFDLPHVDIHSIPVTDFPLYDHWSYDRIYRNDMIKQPDVLMFLFLYNQSFSADCKRANYEFYEPKTIHESSLSPSVHSILAEELGKDKEALEFFGFATRMDLDDYNRNASQGLHTTSIAAAWMNIVYGFGGVRTDGEKFLLAPKIPKIWNKYSFRLTLDGRPVKVTVTHRETILECSAAGKTPLRLYGKDVVLENKLTATV